MASRRRLAALAIVAGVVFAACGSDDEDTTTDTEAASDTTAAAEDGGTATTAAAADGEFAGTTVTILSSIRDVEAERLNEAWASFEAETGIDIVHEGSATFEDDLKLRVDGGDAPDLAFVPQPGLLATLARDGKVVPLADTEADVLENDVDGWVELRLGRRQVLRAAVRREHQEPRLVQPGGLRRCRLRDPHHVAGNARPQPARSSTDGGTPWCVGAESGGATGWVLTDWVEDVMLRTAGAEIYDQWVTHEIPFNDPAVRGRCRPGRHDREERRLRPGRRAEHPEHQLPGRRSAAARR